MKNLIFLSVFLSFSMGLKSSSGGAYTVENLIRETARDNLIKNVNDYYNYLLSLKNQVTKEFSHKVSAFNLLLSSEQLDDPKYFEDIRNNIRTLGATNATRAEVVNLSKKINKAENFINIARQELSEEEED